MSDVIYKIATKAQWAATQATGVFPGAPVDLADGFVHFSTAAQVRETAARHFAGQDDLMLLTVSTELLSGELRYEPSRGGERFPHLYGPLPIGAVRDAQPLALGPDGQHVWPQELRD